MILFCLFDIVIESLLDVKLGIKSLLTVKSLSIILSVFLLLSDGLSINKKSLLKSAKIFSKLNTSLSNNVFLLFKSFFSSFIDSLIFLIFSLIIFFSSGDLKFTISVTISFILLSIFGIIFFKSQF